MWKNLVLFSHSEPFVSGFLEPKNLFLKKGRIKLYDEVFLQDMQVMRKDLGLSFLDAFDTGQQISFVFKDVTKDFSIPSFNILSKIVNSFKEFKIFV